MADKQRSGVIAMAMLPVQVFQDPIVQANTATSDFTIDRLMITDESSTLYLIIPPSDINRLQPLIRMVMEILITRRFGRMETAPKQRMLLLMDEFTSLGKLEIFEKALTYMAGYDIKFCSVIQDFSQLHAVYGRDESIFSNCHVRVAFAPNRYETARTLSEMTGKTTVVQHKRGTSGSGVDKSVSDSGSVTGQPLLTPEEVMNLRLIESAGNKVRPEQA
ncbi:MAG: type IV secretory system conjugative DNA transfer family protein [Alphaproteobacteria bacterium]|nr:type IV secretory system conjugative DNA transfer family protein [Alphaproteobacteria bacterium]